VPRLSTSDYRDVLDVLAEAGVVDGPIPCPESVLDALRRLVPCDVVAYHEELTPGTPTIVFAGQPRGEMTQQIRDAHRRYSHQDPIRPAAGARKYSDFLSRREYHRLELYQDVDQPLGIEYMMRLWLDPTGACGARLEFDRADSDFRERDRAVLDLLLPYLKRLRQRSASRRHEPAPPLNGIDRLTSREREILRRVAEGRTNAEVAALLRISPQTVRKHLENCSGKLGVHTRPGAVAALFTPQLEAV
jgi:DNA-binding CsgD family transcriptional regulator